MIISVVAPHAGAWIEIPTSANVSSKVIVAPHAGAWIEMVTRAPMRDRRAVAPHAGAWIEIGHNKVSFVVLRSRPTRARGLKSSAQHLGL